MDIYETVNNKKKFHKNHYYASINVKSLKQVKNRDNKFISYIKIFRNK